MGRDLFAYQADEACFRRMADLEMPRAAICGQRSSGDIWNRRPSWPTSRKVCKYLPLATSWWIAYCGVTI